MAIEARVFSQGEIILLTQVDKIARTFFVSKERVRSKGTYFEPVRDLEGNQIHGPSGMPLLLDINPRFLFGMFVCLQGRLKDLDRTGLRKLGMDFVSRQEELVKHGE